MRLIDADKVNKTIERFIGYLDEDMIYRIKMKISEIPTVADYEQRPHGEWIRHIDDLYPEESTEECSVCHEEQRITGNDDDFCPNCGADMREEGDEK